MGMTARVVGKENSGKHRNVYDDWLAALWASLCRSPKTDLASATNLFQRSRQSSSRQHLRPRNTASDPLAIE